MVKGGSLQGPAVEPRPAFGASSGLNSKDAGVRGPGCENHYIQDEDDECSATTASQFTGGDYGAGGPIRGPGSGSIGGPAPCPEPEPRFSSPDARGRSKSPNAKDSASKKCRLCGKLSLADESGAGSQYCREDKQAVEDLRKQTGGAKEKQRLKDNLHFQSLSPSSRPNMFLSGEGL